MRRFLKLATSSYLEFLQYYLCNYYNRWRRSPTANPTLRRLPVRLRVGLQRRLYFVLCLHTAM